MGVEQTERVEHRERGIEQSENKRVEQREREREKVEQRERERGREVVEREREREREREGVISSQKETGLAMLSDYYCFILLFRILLKDTTQCHQ